MGSSVRRWRSSGYLLQLGQPVLRELADRDPEAGDILARQPVADELAFALGLDQARGLQLLEVGAGELGADARFARQ